MMVGSSVDRVGTLPWSNINFQSRDVKSSSGTRWRREDVTIQARTNSSHGPTIVDTEKHVAQVKHGLDGISEVSDCFFVLEKPLLIGQRKKISLPGPVKTAFV